MTLANIGTNFVIFLFSLVLPLCIGLYWSIRLAMRHERDRPKMHYMRAEEVGRFAEPIRTYQDRQERGA